MGFQLKSSSEPGDKVFLQREWVSLAIVFILVVLGNRTSSATILGLAAIFILFCILKSDVSNAFCWALFLIPNIRMLDGIGIKFIVNAMMALPLLVYFIKVGAKKVFTIALLGSSVLFFMELLHDAVLCNLRSVVNLLAWSLNIFLCISVSLDSRVKVSNNDILSAFSTGIIMSAIMYLAAGLTSISRIITSLQYNSRFSAFSDDPNYYSLYITLNIACILNASWKESYKICVSILLIGIGLLTASKMCLIVMTFECVLICISLFNNSRDNQNNRRFIIEFLGSMISALIVFRDYFVIFIHNFFRRLGGSNSQGVNLNTMTTGRFGILVEYIEILYNNTLCLLIGYGFNYHQFLGQSSMKGAHNTYLDIILSWGLVGTIIFLIVIASWFKSFKVLRNVKNISFIKFIPILILLINFLDLSCLSASMFPFVIAVSILQWIPSADNEVCETSR